MSTQPIELSDLLDDDSGIFLDKSVLKPNHQVTNIKEVLHRNDVILQYYTYLKDLFKGVSPSNLFIYGKPGLGKTMLTNLVKDKIIDEAEKRGVELCVININCEETSTEHAILQTIYREIPISHGCTRKAIGNSTDKHVEAIKKLINEYHGIILIIFDEFDKAVKPGMINKLIRIQSTASGQEPTIIAITNNIRLKEQFPPHLTNTLCENEILISPYDAEQIADILKARAATAFKPDALDDMVIPLCSALAAQEFGDARKAIELLRVSGEIAEQNGRQKVVEDDVRKARDKIDIDRITEIVKTLPTQSKLVLYSSILLRSRGIEGKTITSGEVYNVYRQTCHHIDIDILTHRRINDLIAELEQLGIVHTIVISKGRYGRATEISLNVPIINTKNVLLDDYRLKSLVDFKASVFNKMFA